MTQQIQGPAGGDADGNKNWKARGFIKFGLVCVLILGGGLGGWAATAKLAGAVIAMGQLRVENNRQVVQHIDGGVVDEILVREGDRVSAGDILLRLDSARLDAELAALESQLFEIISRRGRLEAIQTGDADITFDPELIEAAEGNPEFRALMKGQINLLAAQRESMAKEREVLAERKAQFEEQIRGTEAEIASLERQTSLIAEELVGMRQLLASGNVPKTRVLALEREEARLQGETGQLISRVAQLKGQISEMDIELLRMTATMLEEAIAESRELGYRELELRERRLSLREQLARLDVRSPVDGIILDMTIFALQAVVRPADPILYVVPDNSKLVIDARIDPISRDEVFPGQDATMRFSAFNSRTTPEVFGSIGTISPDVTIDEQTGVPFYKIEVDMNPGEIEKLEGQDLVAGMPVEVFVQTAERTPLNYIMRPVLDYFYRAGRQD